jgi:hypothetical protein
MCCVSRIGAVLGGGGGSFLVALTVRETRVHSRIIEN